MVLEKKRRAQATIEYALLIAFVVVLITAIGYFIKTRVLA
ncbi:class III signal peptide-containing protein [Candidatus Micrarchaeota archaeon]|nr:class III signal peptide-containing protein [Candidatus Micrarchaeota archaeon]